jgi:hypothetical protein
MQRSTNSSENSPLPLSNEEGEVVGSSSPLASSVVGQVSSVVSNNRNPVRVWLEELNLPQLIPIFQENGIDEMELVKTLKEEEVVAMGITQLGAKRKILMYAAKYGSNAQGPTGRNAACTKLLVRIWTLIPAVMICTMK